MNEKIATKQQMYELLRAGRLGNTIPSWSSVLDWKASPDSRLFFFWGVRTMTPGGPCRLFCPTAEVADIVADFAQPVNISIMVDAIHDVTVTLWADCYEAEDGLYISATEYPPKGANWRKDKPILDKEFRGIAANHLLRKHMDENSREDLRILLDEYPGHVVEFSCLNKCLGLISNRNSIVWECRYYLIPFLAIFLGAFN